MINIDSKTANKGWLEAVKMLRSNGCLQESRDEITKELLHVSFKIEDPRQRIVFARPINPAFAIAEVLWILSGSNDLNFLKFWNPRMKLYSDDKISLYGAYGFRLGRKISLPTKTKSELYRHNEYKANGIDQIKNAYYALKNSPHSRQVVLQIWDSFSDLPSPNPRSKDIPCNLLSHLLLRDNKLEWLQVMRSNDLFWGTPYNFIQFTMIQEIIAGWLGVDVGSYNHISDSLHVYNKHFKDVMAVSEPSLNLPNNNADLRIKDIDEWEEVWSRLLIYTMELSKISEMNEILDMYEGITNRLPTAYVQLAATLTAEVLRKNGHIVESYKMIHNAGEYWGYSWINWANSVKDPLIKSRQSIPKLIIFEGPDGTGKTTYVKMLKKYLEKDLNKKVFEDGYPGNIPGTLGEFVYKVHHNNFFNAPKIEDIQNSAVQLLHVAAHIDKIESHIKPALNNDEIVLLDRYWWSTYAYSRVTMDKEKALKLLEPELAFWEELDIKPTAIYLKQAKSFKEDEIDKGRFKELDNFYKEVIELERRNGINIIEIENSDSIENTFKSILESLKL